MNIQTKIDFHFVKCRFSEMPCINRTAEILIHFRRSELFYYFCIHPAFCRILLMPREPYILYLPFFLGLFCSPRITFSST